MCHCFGVQQLQGVLHSCERLFCLFSPCVCFSACLLFLLFGVQPVEQWKSHTHRHTLRYLSEMPSGGHLCFPDTLHQTLCSTVYKACLLESINQTGVKACSVTQPCFQIESERPLMIFSDVCFLQNEEKSQSEVSFSPPTPPPSWVFSAL